MVLKGEIIIFFEIKGVQIKSDFVELLEFVSSKNVQEFRNNPLIEPIKNNIQNSGAMSTGNKYLIPFWRFIYCAIHLSDIFLENYN